MKTFNFIIIKLTCCLTAGICCAYLTKVNIANTIFLSIALILILFILAQVAKRSYNKTIWFGLVSYVLMFVVGILAYAIHDHNNYKQHYTNTFKDLNNNPHEIIGVINERLKPSTYHDKYIVEILKINEQNVKGKVLINIQKENNSKTYGVDDVVFIKSEFQEIRSPLNPNQFNYKDYLKKQNVNHQLFTEQHLIFEIPSETKTIFGYADSFRQQINLKLNQFHFKPEELAIINALLLGQRQEMDREIYTNYAKAGAIHILAVSGLHVGLILMIINVILKPLEHLKKGNLLKLILILGLLWSFAVIAGLSASVTRAVTMFSIVAMAMSLKRPTNIYNTLSISIFILLLFQPSLLFDVGFQMSYLAVFAIVSFQPILYRLWKPKWKVIDYFWQIFTVTIAAQLGVAPISLFYFHQFPGLFFITNLAIIPFLGLILGFGILIILLSQLNILPQFLANAYGQLITSMNELVSWVSSQDQFLIKDISLDLIHVFGIYLMLLALFLVYMKFNFLRIVLVLVSILTLQSIFIYSKNIYSKETFIIFHKNRHSILGKKQHSHLSVWHNLDSTDVANDNIIRQYKIGNFIKTVDYDSLSNVYDVDQNTLLIIDSLGVYNVSFNPDYILLRNSPKINLKRVIEVLHPKLIIADGSNYKSYIKRWKATCKHEKLPFHQTGEKGAFIIEY